MNIVLQQHYIPYSTDTYYIDTRWTWTSTYNNTIYHI